VVSEVCIILKFLELWKFLNYNQKFQPRDQGARLLWSHTGQSFATYKSCSGARQEINFQPRASLCRSVHYNQFLQLLGDGHLSLEEDIWMAQQQHLLYIVWKELNHVSDTLLEHLKCQLSGSAV
jgi:hypothetical protein